MRNRNNGELSNDASAKEVSDRLSHHLDNHVDLQFKKKMSVIERGKASRNIEDIKERNRLKAVLGEDYELLDS